MRLLFPAVAALGFALASGAAFAQSNQGGYSQSNTPNPAGNAMPASPGVSPSYGSSGANSGSTGVDAPTRDTGGDVPSVGQSRNEGPSTYGVPNKVGGSGSHR